MQQNLLNSEGEPIEQDKLSCLENAANGISWEKIDSLQMMMAVRIFAHDKLILLLDYDGTLVPFASTPDQAAPDHELLDLLRELSRRQNTAVHIISGRDRTSLDAWFADVSIGLHAEHGLWSRPHPRDDWRAANDIPAHWKERVLPIIEEFTQQTPGSLIEMKSASIAWHYRLTNPELGDRRAHELQIQLAAILADFQMHVLLGDKVVEVKLQNVDKGRIVQSFFAEQSRAILVALGDDRTDEDLFAALPRTGIALHVGPNPSAAPYRLEDYRAARAFLKELLVAGH